VNACGACQLPTQTLAKLCLLRQPQGKPMGLRRDNNWSLYRVAGKHPGKGIKTRAQRSAGTPAR